MKKLKLLVSVLLIFTVIAGIAAPINAENTDADEGIVAQVNDAEVSETPTDAEPAETPAEENEEEEHIPSYKDTNLPIRNKIYDNGVKIHRTKDVLGLFHAIRVVFGFITGKSLVSPPRTLEVTMDEDIQELCDYIKNNTSFDPSRVITGVPDLSDPARLIGKVLHLNVTEYRTQMKEQADEAYAAGDKTKGDMFSFLGSYLSVIEKADLFLEPYGSEENTYEVICVVTYGDGGTERFHPGIIINTETGKCGGTNENGMGGIGFNCDVYDLLVYAPMNCWMRDFGFCVEYDFLCYVLPMYRYNTRRFHFDYAGKEWMIQAWKGNYYITNGAEVGIYNREPGSRGTFYKCISDEERMPMSMDLYHGDEVLLNLEETNHWWVNGFKMGYRIYSPHSMTMIFSIVFPDEEMMNAFCEAVDKEIHRDVTYTTDGLKVTCTWYK